MGKVFALRGALTWSSRAVASLFSSAVSLPAQSAFGLLLDLDERNMCARRPPAADRPACPCEPATTGRRALRFDTLAPPDAEVPRPGNSSVARYLAGAGGTSDDWTAYDFHLHNASAAVLATSLVYPSAGMVTRYSIFAHGAALPAPPAVSPASLPPLSRQRTTSISRRSLALWTCCSA